MGHQEAHQRGDARGLHGPRTGGRRQARPDPAGGGAGSGVSALPVSFETRPAGAPQDEGFVQQPHPEEAAKRPSRRMGREPTMETQPKHARARRLLQEDRRQQPHAAVGGAARPRSRRSRARLHCRRIGATTTCGRSSWRPARSSPPRKPSAASSSSRTRACAASRASRSSLYAGLQLILPGEVAPAHRHTQSALRFIVEGTGAYTAVDGERTIMRARRLRHHAVLDLARPRQRQRRSRWSGSTGSTSRIVSRFDAQLRRGLSRGAASR